MVFQSSARLCAVFGLLFLWGCGSNPTLSEYQCSAGDWYTVGHTDGRNGHGQARLLAHQNACGPQGIVPDSAAYRQGWSRGIAQFCEPQRGYQLGSSGRSQPKTCPEQHQQSFAQAYNDGRRLYLARYEVNRIEKSIAASEQRFDRINTEVIQLAAAQLADGLSPQDRIRLATNTQELVAEQRRIRRNLPQLHRDLDKALDHLEMVETSTPQLAIGSSGS